jgi:hypothetical protein
MNPGGLRFVWQFFQRGNDAGEESGGSDIR